MNLDRHYLQQSMRVILYWFIMGVFASGFEVILFHDERDFNEHMAIVSLYLFPPIIVGHPFLVIEKKLILEYVERLRFKYAVLLRAIYYLAAIILIYKGIQFFGSKIFPSYDLFQPPFLIKYIFVWGVGSILALLFHNITVRHDRKVLRSWLKGEFHIPKMEERVFLFMDIDGSTALAEKLGSEAYFKFLDKFYSLITPVIQQFKGEIYQYVGDEIVVSWPLHSAFKNNNALETFFYIKEVLKQHEDDFHREFRFVPTLKGSLHYGPVTKGELKAVKRELIYTGDTLNTASRMYSICKARKVSLVISRRLLKKFNDISGFDLRDEGYFQPRGKNEKIYVYSVSKAETI